jgi:hypothetical protein
MAGPHMAKPPVSLGPSADLDNTGIGLALENRLSGVIMGKSRSRAGKARPPCISPPTLMRR